MQRFWTNAGEDWVIFWAIESASDQPLSMRAHLYSTPDAPPLVDDALGYTADQWRAGDTLWQRHDFAVIEDAHYLETGLYNFQNLEEVGEMLRLPAAED